MLCACVIIHKGWVGYSGRLRTTSFIRELPSAPSLCRLGPILEIFGDKSAEVEKGAGLPRSVADRELCLGIVFLDRLQDVLQPS